MKSVKVLAILVLSAVFLIVSTLFLIGYFKPKVGGVFVDTNPSSSVYINGELMGKTPYKGTSEPGEITIKLVPNDSSLNLLPYETKMKLVSGIETIVRREFGTSEDRSSGDIISFEKEGEDASLVVISTPDNAQISVDGVPRGFSPYRTATITPASHQITVKASGYSDRVMTVETKAGFRLTLFAKLAKEEIKNESEEKSPEVFVEILETPTGFLRVRTSPGSAGQEIAEVKAGEKYPFLEQDENSGWYKIKYGKEEAGLPNGIEGWISNQYSRKVEEATESATIN